MFIPFSGRFGIFPPSFGALVTAPLPGCGKRGWVEYPSAASRQVPGARLLWTSASMGNSTPTSDFDERTRPSGAWAPSGCKAPLSIGCLSRRKSYRLTSSLYRRCNRMWLLGVGDFHSVSLVCFRLFSGEYLTVGLILFFLGEPDQSGWLSIGPVGERKPPTHTQLRPFFILRSAVYG